MNDFDLEWLVLIFFGVLVAIGFARMVNEPVRRLVRRLIPVPAWREQREIEDAERRRVESVFLDFVRETRPLAPKAKQHQDAAVYRHAWKRAAVLEIIAQREENDERAALYRQFQKLASGQYYPIAPSNAYGTVQLRLEPSAAQRLLELEEKRLLPPEPKGQKRKKPGASKPCVYIGRSSDGKVYVGQTQEPPEKRWLQHRTEGTGPFKDGHPDIDWKVVETDVPAERLNERESYFIGLLSAIDDGYNENRGNDADAYEQGRTERLATRSRG